MTGVRIQKLPKRDTAAHQMVLALYQAPGHTMTLDELLALLPGASRHSLTNTASRWELCTDTPRIYQLPEGMRRLLAGEAALADAEAPPIVPPRVIDLIHRPAWISNLSAQARRPDAGPVHDITHYASGTAPTPFRGSTQ